MSSRTERPFIVEDLKQYLYCPRIVYFERCMPGIRPRTYSMDIGHEDHAESQQNARRRSLAALDITEGERAFSVEIVDAELNLHGKLDEVITTSAGERIPVEYKSSRKLADNHRLQIAAYALLLQRAEEVEVSRAFVYLMPLRKTRTLRITAEDKAQVEVVLSQISRMVTTEWMPEPTPIRARCAACEFRRFCNDV
jgi:CRISPR-associated exonuclease Cas4